MGIRAFCGTVLCFVLVMLLCGCKSVHLVYNTNMEDTWYAVQSAVRYASGGSAYKADHVSHRLETCRVRFDTDWGNPNIPSVSNDPDSIRYGSTDPHRDSRTRRAYWYAVVECREADSGTEVIAHVEQQVEYYPAEDGRYNDNINNEACPEADEWMNRFYNHLNEHLGEPVKVKK